MNANNSQQDYYIRNIILILCSLIYAPISVANSLDFSIVVSSPNNTPELATNAALINLCPEYLANNANSSSDLFQTCNYISNTATPDEIIAITQALSAKPNTVSNIISARAISKGNLNGIGIRLFGLRNVTKRLTASSFRLNLTEEVGGLFSQRLSSFLNLKYISSDQQESVLEIGSEASSTGLLFGADYRLTNNSFIGIAGQYDKITAELTDKRSQLDSNNFGIIFYGTHNINRHWYVESTLNSNSQNFNLQRHINYSLGPNNINTIAKSDTGSRQLGFYLGSGYEVSLPFGINSIASIGASYVSAKLDSYKEESAGDLSLNIDSQSSTSFSSIGNVSFSKVFSHRIGVIIPQVSLSWVHETSEEKQAIAATFTNDTTDSTFVFNTPAPDPNYFIAGLDLQLLLPRGRIAYVKYSTLQRFRDTTQYSITAGFRAEY